MMDMACEFVCADCQANVVHFGATEPPADGLCVICSWIAEQDPAFQAALREQLGRTKEK